MQPLIDFKPKGRELYSIPMMNIWAKTEWDIIINYAAGPQSTQCGKAGQDEGAKLFFPSSSMKETKELLWFKIWKY